jgi:hypothetical protein
MSPIPFVRRRTTSAARAARKPRRPAPRWRPALEALEGRVLPAGHLVTPLGIGSLTVNANVVVNKDAKGNANAASSESEMSVTINPTNPLNVVGFAHDLRNLNQIQVFDSTDGGLTWGRRLITNVAKDTTQFNDGFGAGQRFDPAIKFDATGKLYVAYGVDNGANTRLVVGVSGDGGNTFTRFTQVANRADFQGAPGVDKWQIATGQAGPNTTTQAVYVAFNSIDTVANRRIFVLGSKDGGVNFTLPRSIDDSHKWNGSPFACPAVGPNGELYVSWMDDNQKAILLARDLVGLFAVNSNFGPNVVVQKLNVFLQVSVDKPPAQPNRGISNGAVLVVNEDRFSFGLGQLHIVYTDGYQGSKTDTEIYMVTSGDQGAHWTQIAANVHGNVEGATATSFLPWIAMDPDTGTISVAYYTTDGAPDNTQVNVRLAVSDSGGLAWIHQNLTTQTSRASSATLDSPNDFLEYIGLDVRDGTAQAFWADNRGATKGTFVNELHAFTASVAYKGFNVVGSGNKLTITGDDGGVVRNDGIALSSAPGNPNFAVVAINGQTPWAGLWASISDITITPGYGNDSVTVRDCRATGALNISTLSGNKSVAIDGIQKESTLHIATGNGDDTINVQSLPQTDNEVIISCGSLGSDKINVNATHGPMSVYTSSGNDTVTVGYASEDLHQIAGDLTIHGGTGANKLIINDLLDPSAETIRVTSTSVRLYGSLVADSAPITFFGFHGGLMIRDGVKDHNQFVGTPVSAAPGMGTTPTTLFTGPGVHNVEILGISGPLTVDGTGGTAHVTVGLSGLVSGIQNNVSLHGGSISLDVNDANNAAHRTALLDVDAATATGLLYGFTPSHTSISFQESALAALSVELGSGGNLFDVFDTPANALGAMTTISTKGAPAKVNTFNVYGTHGPLAIEMLGGDDDVFVAPRTSAANPISGDVAITGPVDHFYIFDTMDTSPAFVSFAAGTFTGLGAPIDYQNVKYLTFRAGTGGASISVEGNPAGTTLTLYSGGVGQDEFLLNSDPNILAGPVFIHGQAAAGDYAIFFDYNSPTGHAYAFTSTTLERDGATAFTFDGLNEVLLAAAHVGGNTVEVQSVASGGAATMQMADGDTVTVGKVVGAGRSLGDLAGPVLVDSYTVADDVHVVVDDSANPDLTPRQVSFVLDSANNVNMVGLAPGIAWQLGTNSSVDVYGNAAPQTVAVQPLVAATPLFLHGGTGTNTLDYSAYTTEAYINLVTGTATDLAGEAGYTNATGGSGGNILVGIDKSVLTGGAGNDLLIAGTGHATLNGMGGNDILIGGSTDYDTNRSMLQQILDTWNQAADYQSGVMALTNGLLSHGHVLPNQGGNQLTGGPGQDLFFASQQSEILDLEMNETWIQI